MKRLAIIAAMLPMAFAATPANARQCDLHLFPTNYVVAESITSNTQSTYHSQLPNASSFAQLFAPDNQLALLEHTFGNFAIEGYKFTVERHAPIDDILDFRQSSPPQVAAGSACSVEVVTREVKMLGFDLTGQTASWIFIVRIFDGRDKPTFKVMRGIGGKVRPNKGEDPALTTVQAFRLIEQGLPQIGEQVAEGLRKTFERGNK